MKVRGFALMVALLLAVGATAAVYMYVRGVRQEATAPPDMVSVITSKQDISAGTNLSNLIDSGAFTSVEIPVDALVQGAVTDLSQIEDRTTRFPILQGEQISVARLENSEVQVRGGVLGIPEGHKALTISLGLPQSVGGVVRTGDHVSVYATFRDLGVLPYTLREALAGKVSSTEKVEVGSYTFTLVPDAQLLKVGLPESGGVGSGDGEEVAITLALTPRDAQFLVHAKELGTVWLSLLPPNEKGTDEEPVSAVNLLID
jgi:Flp pilus assembly protein CpaB